MARLKRDLKIRRKQQDGTVTVERKVVYTAQTVRRPSVTMWDRAATMDPERKHLTKSQWAERGDLIRSLKLEAPDILLEGASLDNLRDMKYSITRCQINIVRHMQDSGQYNYPVDRGLVLNV